jgi:hypothetical protein
MGADIRLWVECRKHDAGFEAIVPSESNIADALATVRDPAGWVRMQLISRDLNWFFPRNYFDFALLDGRRVPWGFAPLISARGLPADISDEVSRALDGWGITNPSAATLDELDRADIGSPSWFTLDELLAVDWTMGIPCQREVLYTVGEWPHNRVLDLDAFGTFVAESGRYPSEWHGRSIVVTDPDPVSDAGCFDGFLATTEPVGSVAHDLRRLMNQMSKLSADPTEVRAVYWFDQLFGFRQPLTS